MVLGTEAGHNFFYGRFLIAFKVVTHLDFFSIIFLLAQWKLVFLAHTVTLMVRTMEPVYLLLAPALSRGGMDSQLVAMYFLKSRI